MLGMLLFPNHNKLVQVFILDEHSFIFIFETNTIMLQIYTNTYIFRNFVGESSLTFCTGYNLVLLVENSSMMNM